MDSKMIKKQIKRLGGKEFLNVLLSGVLAVNLVAYQIFLPFSIAHALAGDAEDAVEVIEEADAADEDKGEEGEESEEGDGNEGDGEEDGEENNEAEESMEEDVEEASVAAIAEASTEASAEAAAEETAEDETGDDEANADANTGETSGEIEIVDVNVVGIDNDASSESTTGENRANGNGVGAVEEETPAVDVADEDEPDSTSAEAAEEDGEEEDEEKKDGEEAEGIEREELPSGPEISIEASTEAPLDTSLDTSIDVSIETGDALAETAIVNEANTNIVGTNWVDSIINLYGAYNGDINLLEIFNSILELSNAQLMQLAGEISNTNDAQVNNTATADANSGNNQVSGNDGDASIITGDATATADVVNIINRNIVGNNWLFAFVNVFGNWTGDLIVPGEGLLTIPISNSYSEIQVANQNSADIQNVVSAEADSGNNTADGNEGSAVIEAGEANSSAQAVNIANTNITSNNWFSLMVNTAGAWMGGVNNWQEEQDGGTMATFQYLFGVDEDNLVNGTLTVLNINTASIYNFVSAYANTGGNDASGNGGDASIITGDTGAFATATNFVNTNIVGNNWLFAFVNVVGAWEGNVEFAYPDLDISISDGKDSALEGETLEYTVAFKNNGKAAAQESRVTVALSSASDDISYSSHTSSDSMKVSGAKYVWEVPILAPGQSKSFKVKAKIADPLSSDNSEIIALAEIDTATTEQEKGNNSDFDKTIAKKIPIEIAQNTPEGGYGYDYDYGGGSDNDDKLDSGLKVKRYRTIAGPVNSGEIVYHAIVVENNGEGPVFDVKVRDAMMFSEGEKIAEFEWPIGDLGEGDKMLVEYQLLINESAIPGAYTFNAKAKGDDPYDDEVRSKTASIPMDLLRPLTNSAIAGLDQGTGQPFEFVPGALAADEGIILGATAGGTGECLPLPLWIWLSALVAYAFAVNWSLFPTGKNKTRKQSNLRTYGVPAIATAGSLALWLAFRCDALLWFPISTFIILLAHLLIKKQTLPQSTRSKVKTQKSKPQLANPKPF